MPPEAGGLFSIAAPAMDGLPIIAPPSIGEPFIMGLPPAIGIPFMGALPIMPVLITGAPLLKAADWTAGAEA